MDLRGLPSDPLRVLSLCSTCQDLSFPTLTQQFWVPETTHGGQHKSKNYLWFPACLPLGRMCEIYCCGMCRALADGKAAQSHLPTRQKVADTWQTVMLKVFGANTHWGFDYCFTCSSVTLHGFTVVQSWKAQQLNTHPPWLYPIQCNGLFFHGRARARSSSTMTGWYFPDLEIRFVHVFGVVIRSTHKKSLSW